MFKRFWAKPKGDANGIATLDKLNEALIMLEKKENFLLKKVAAEVEQAKEFTREKSKKMIMIEGAKATTEALNALRTGAGEMKAVQKAMNINDVDKTMDEINEQTENIKHIQEALSAPIGAADFDEEELEAELEELEEAELEEELLKPAKTVSPVAVHQQSLPTTLKNTAEEDELAALQAEMAL